jgi:hypothetical protein
MNHPEHDAQVALFAWIRMHEANWPMLRFCAAWPNGGARSKITAAQMKAEGTRRGPPDIWLVFRTAHYNGLVIELKHGRNKPSSEQKEWLSWLASQGFKTAVCYSWITAAKVIREYLGMPNDMLGLEEV